MSDSQINPQASDPLVYLKNVLDRDPELFFGRIKRIFNFGEDFQLKLVKFAEKIKGGYSPIIYANHQSHADGVVISIVIEELRKLLPNNTLNGFLCPVAASMASGDQNDKVQGGTFMFQPIFNKIGFIYVPIIREDDRRKYGMEGSNREAIEKLITAPKQKFGITVFPEGTVRGGRKDSEGNIFGMQKVAGGGILLRCIKMWEMNGQKSVLLPVGITDSYKIFDPDSYAVPLPLLQMIAGIGQVTQMVNARVGESFTPNEIKIDIGGDLDAKSQDHADYLMRKIASLLPERARGYYK